MDDYPLLRNLIGAYFNQDIDIIAGTDSFEGQVEYYLADASEGFLRALTAEMDEFEARHPGELDDAFIQTFHPEVEIDDVGQFFADFRAIIQSKRNV
ncbi:contact-dependent growth inhibition system immunity protein [Brenneria goodwinii]|uniref:contact-dependent growth inhibition system immunity protein n=1 Tax=Brenneria goodwinii TaxID=1109412 RepID=UPI0036F158B0